MNDKERRLWVLNEESLYLCWKRSGVGLYRFVRENREEIDRAIRSILE